MASAEKSPDTPVIRVKRLRTEDPAEALLIHQSSKRPKIQFDYVGTRSEPEPKDLALQAKDVKTRTKAAKNSLTNRRTAKSTRSSQSRYEFVSKSRGEGFCDVLKVANEGESGVISCNDVPLVEQQKDYVYDFYYAHVSSKELDFTAVTNVYAYDFIVNEELSDSDEFRESDDDSNDENNYRNDYPDEESEDEDGYYYGEDHSDEDYYGQFDRLRITDEYCSGDEDDKVFSRESDDEDSRLGSAYSRYKKRIAREEAEEFY